MTQADIEARARPMVFGDIHILKAMSQAEARAFMHLHEADSKFEGGRLYRTDEAEAALIAAMLAFREEARREAFAEAAEVAREQARLNAQARRDRADDELAFEFEGLGNVIATAIAALGEQGRLG